MQEHKETIINSLCNTIEMQDKLIKHLEGEIDYYKTRVNELEESRRA